VIKKLNERIVELEKKSDSSKNSRTIEEARNTSHNQTSAIKSKVYIETP